MKHRELILVLLLAAALLATGVTATEANTPLAEAGLDQSVTQGTTVYLDGGGSHAPDGEIVAYRWAIESPGGTETTPEDPNGVRTTFEADELGVYEVTLTVTDDAGRTANDTLYVDVSRGEPPSVSVEGPNATLVGSEETFNAAISPGDAAIEEVTWKVDGEPVASFSDVESASDFSHQFETLGTAELAVTVVDEAGQRATATTVTDVVEPESSDSGGSSGSNGWYDGTAADADPVIEGPQIVDGEKPLEATHRISSASTSQVESVTWLVDGDPVGEGVEYSATWDPGEYTLSAVVRYEDGSKRVATFEDGSRDVLVNPKPAIELKGFDGFDGSVSGTVFATDEMDSLRSVSIWVDGAEVERWVGRGIGAKQISFKRDGVADNEAHTVTVVATDNLGQERRVTTNVTPVGKPEIVSAEFLNEPVDSYHERIDANRYTAKYEVVVDLNGYPRENISITTNGSKTQPVFKRTAQRRENKDTVRVIYELSYKTPRKYRVKSTIFLSDMTGSLASDRAKRSLIVEPSPPEIRLKIRVNPEGPEYGQRRIFLNASDSFDPDGTALMYSWNPDMVEASVGNSLKNVSQKNEIVLKVVDQHEKSSVLRRSMDAYYSPILKDTELGRENNTYRPDEMVEVSIIYKHHTADWESFQNAPIEIEIVDGNGEVVHWGNNRGSKAETTGRMEAIVEIPAREFIQGERPKVRVYNAKNPDQTTRINTLPKPEIKTVDEPFLMDIQVENVEYLVRKSVFDKVEVDTLAKAKLMAKSDYHIQAEKTRTLYVLEKYVQQEAEYETKVEKFDTKAQRDFFVRGAEENWVSAGSETHTETVTETVTEWRSARSGDGQYTGESRRVQTSEPKYQTEYKYEYETTEYYTEYVDVTRFGTRTVTEERTRTVRTCKPFGCYKHEDSYTVQTTETYTYTVTVARTRSKTVTETYWSTSQLAGDHRRTGATRKKKISDAEYETQYKYEVTSTRTTERTEYLASRTVQTQESINRWKKYDTVSSSSKAGFITRENGIRLAGTKRKSYWVLAKQTGSNESWVSSVSDESDVAKTRADVASDVVEYDLRRRTGQRELRKTGTVEIQFKEENKWTIDEIRSSFEEKDLSTICRNNAATDCRK
ncbi:PKD domain-containing protein [Haloparvum sp. PAK95]|uniref:PKD domain-containing protein n=1 Tax=Haloparvum sp. PAK95 TaxID=3418962 RepID=UPI003D2ED15A